MNTYIQDGLDTVDELNNEDVYGFTFGLETDGDSFSVSLNEYEEFGFSITLFVSDDSNFNDFVEEQYENGFISYKDAIKMQVYMNIEVIINKLSTLK